jgi:hypothetical protein
LWASGQFALTWQIARQRVSATGGTNSSVAVASSWFSMPLDRPSQVNFSAIPPRGGGLPCEVCKGWVRSSVFMISRTGGQQIDRGACPGARVKDGAHLPPLATSSLLDEIVDLRFRISHGGKFEPQLLVCQILRGGGHGAFRGTLDFFNDGEHLHPSVVAFGDSEPSGGHTNWTALYRTQTEAKQRNPKNKECFNMELSVSPRSSQVLGL